MKKISIYIKIAILIVCIIGLYGSINISYAETKSSSDMSIMSDDFIDKFNPKNRIR